MSHLRLVRGGATNSFEAERRLAKVNSLAITLEIMSAELWRETAVVSGQRVPSEKTIAAVVERFERRAELARRVG